MYSTTKKDFSVTEVSFFSWALTRTTIIIMKNYGSKGSSSLSSVVVLAVRFYAPPLSIQSWTFQVMTANKFYSLSNTTFLCLRTYTHTVMTKAFNFLLCLLGAFNTFGILVVMEREKTTIVVCLVDDKSKHEN